MAAAEQPPSPAGLPDTQHDDEDWENQRDNFTLYYKAQNHTLKQATELMMQNHDFHATQRQWERKIVLWGLQKYTSRQARIEAIEMQGRTIAEVAESGRRQQNYLQPNDDRNVRRFARRELSRSRSRSRSRQRSKSFGDRSRSVTPIHGRGRTPSAPDKIVQRENIYNLDVSVLGDGNLSSTSEATPVAIPALPTTQNSQYPQAHVMQTQNMVTGETSNDVFLSLPTESLAQMDTGLAGSQYGYDNMSAFTTDQMMAEVSMPSQTTPFPLLDINTTVAPNFMSSQQDPMSTTSSSYIQDMRSPWDPPMFNNPEYDATPTFARERSHSNHSSFPQSATEDLSITRSLESSIDSQQEPSMGSVPEIVYPPEHSPTFEPSVPTFPLLQMAASQDKHKSIYADCYGSISLYTQAMESIVMEFANGNGMTGHALTQLSNELQSQRAALVSDLTMHLNSYTSTQDRAMQAMRNDVNWLRQQLRGGQPETTSMPAQAHRFSFPEIDNNLPYSTGVSSNFTTS